MKINKKNKTNYKKYILLSGILALVCIAVVMSLKLITTPSPSDSVASPSLTDGSTAAGKDSKTTNSDSSTGNPKLEANPTSKDTSVTPEIAITANSQNGDVYQIRVLVSTISNTGSCTATFERVGYTSLTKTVGTQAGPSSTTCKGFDIATSELSTGDWNVTIQYSDALHSAKISKIVTIK